MRRTITIGLCMLAVTALPAPIASASVDGPSPGVLGRANDLAVPHAAERVLVELRPSAEPSVLGGGAERIFGRWFEVPVRDGEAPLHAARRLAGVEGVATAELDYRLSVDPLGEELVATTATAPSDPFYPYQWHLPPLQLPQAWERSTGAGTVIAIVDTGISSAGEDLGCHAFVAPFDAIADRAGAAVDDHGHGTHVAGTAAQCTDNGVGVAGVASGADLMPVKVANAEGIATSADLAQGIDWAVANGADVINLSLGSECDAVWPACSSSIQNEAIEAAVAAGVVVVAASGNDASGFVSIPANHPDVLAVGAVRLDLARAPYSNGGVALDLVAPGGDVTVDQNADGYGDGVLQETFGGSGWGYYFANGTSMAAPHVSGAVALLRAASPGSTASQVVGALQDSARDLGAAGVDTTYGHGLIQVAAALDALGAGNGGGDLSVRGRLRGADDRDGRFAVVDLDATVRYRGVVTPSDAAEELTFALQRWDRGRDRWTKIASETRGVGATGRAGVTISRDGASFAAPEARLVPGARFRIRAYVADGDSITASAPWALFRVS